MSQSNKVERGNGKNARTTSGLKRLGMWAALTLLTLAAATVFALAACKSSRW